MTATTAPRLSLATMPLMGHVLVGAVLGAVFAVLDRRGNTGTSTQ